MLSAAYKISAARFGNDDKLHIMVEKSGEITNAVWITAAVYDNETGLLSGIAYTPVDRTCEVVMDIKKRENCTIKVFMWKNLAGQKPLQDAYIKVQT